MTQIEVFFMAFFTIFKGAHLMGAVGALAPTVFLPRLEIIHINVPLFLPHSKLYLHMDLHYLVQLDPSDHFHQFFAHFCLRFWLNIWLVLHQFWFKSFFLIRGTLGRILPWSSSISPKIGPKFNQIEVSYSLFHHFHQFLCEGYSGECLGLFGQMVPF